MKRFLGMLLILFLSGCASAPSLEEMKASDPPKDDNLIVPGWRIGKVYLGMTSAALFAAMGEPDSRNPRFCSVGWKNGLNACHDKNADQVIDIYAGSGSHRFQTAEGVHIGMSELAVVAKLGNPEASQRKNMGDMRDGSEWWQGLYCYKRGLQVSFDSNLDNSGKGAPCQVVAIYVVPSKKWRDSLCK